MSLITLGLAIYAVCSLLSMATMSIGAAILGGLFALSLKQRPDFSPTDLQKYLKACYAVTAACFLSLLYGKLNPLSFDGRIPTIHLFFDSMKLWYFFWPVLIFFALKRINDEEKILVLKCWLITFTILSALGILQHFIGWPRPQEIPGDPGRYHATLFLGHHLSVASVFIFPFFVLLDFLREALINKKKPILPLRFLIAGAVLGFTTLMLTYSRTLWVALPIGILIWGANFLPKDKKSRKKQLIALAALVVLAFLTIQIPSIHSRIFAPIGVQTRADLWEANYQMFLDRPLTGVGLKHNQELSGFYLMAKYHTTDVFSGHAHNNVLDLLGGTGLIGLAACVFWFVLVFHFLIRGGVKVAGYNLTAGIVCALIVFQLNGLTQVNFWEAKVQHQLMWMVGWILFGAIGG
jgi:O-antigen ligase